MIFFPIPKITWSIPNAVPVKKSEDNNGENAENITPESSEMRLEDEEEEDDTETEDRSWRR